MMPEMANRWTALALVFLTRTSMGFQFQSVASVAPLMIADLGLSYTQLGTLTGLYMLPGVLFAATGSLIGQRLGERRVVLGGLGLMVLGGIVTASAVQRLAIPGIIAEAPRRGHVAWYPRPIRPTDLRQPPGGRGE